MRLTWFKNFDHIRTGRSSKARSTSPKGSGASPGRPTFPRRAIFDARLAYTLAAEGVTRFATRNVRDFQRFGAFEVFDPLVETS